MKVGFLLLLAMVTASAQTLLQHLHDVQVKYLALESAPGSPADLPAVRSEYWRAVTAALQAADKVAQYGHDGGFALPDPTVTPGAVDPDCLADRSGARHMVRGTEENICAKDFRTKPIRATISNFPKLKREACAEYGVAKCDASVEGDHLISIEACGKPDDVRNIWPQPMNQARVKDNQVEDKVPKLVCAGKMSLRQAQECLSYDWVSCAAKIKALK